jgi:predicted Fe-Mo cluster-binding NifX family protein
MPIIALPSNENGGLNDSLSVRFGRCDNITIVSIEEKRIVAVKVIPIQKDKAMGNLGTFVAKIIKENGATEVIVKFIGFKAFKALSNEKIHIYNILEKSTDLKQCIDIFNRGEMQLLKEPNAHLFEE